MRYSLSILMLVCFVLISASVNYGSGYAQPVDPHASQTQTALAATGDQSVSFLTTAWPGEHASETSKNQCSCKEKKGAAKLVCSVTLAFSNNIELLHSPAKSKTRYAIAKFAALQSYIHELKRPPRNIL